MSVDINSIDVDTNVYLFIYARSRNCLTKTSIKLFMLESRLVSHDAACFNVIHK